MRGRAEALAEWIEQEAGNGTPPEAMYLSRSQLDDLLGILHTPDTRGEAVGWVAESDLPIVVEAPIHDMAIRPAGGITPVVLYRHPPTDGGGDNG